MTGLTLARGALILAVCLPTFAMAGPQVTVTATGRGTTVEIGATASDVDGPGLATLEVTLDGRQVYLDAFAAAHMAQGVAVWVPTTLGAHVVGVRAVNKDGEAAFMAVHVSVP